MLISGRKRQLAKRLDRLYRYACALAHDDVEAADAVHAVVERTIRLKGDLDAVEDSYLRVAIKRQCIDLGRSKQRRKEDAFVEEEHTVSMLEVDFSQALIAEQEVETLLQQLTPDERELVYLHCVEGCEEEDDCQKAHSH